MIVGERPKWCRSAVRKGNVEVHSDRVKVNELVLKDDG